MNTHDLARAIDRIADRLEIASLCKTINLTDKERAEALEMSEELASIAGEMLGEGETPLEYLESTWEPLWIPVT